MRCMQPGDEFIASTKLYGGSINQFNHAFKNFGWQVKWADPDEPAVLSGARSPRRPRRSSSNRSPIPAASSPTSTRSRRSRKSANVPLIVDNTLATPYLLRPIEHGADIIVHSATKYLGGHGNSMGGVIVDCGSFNWFGDKRYPMLSAPRPEYNGMVLSETFGNFAFAIACRVLGLRDLGPAISPFNSFLILTGIETLRSAHAAPLRQRAWRSRSISQSHDKVGWVSYAGLPGNRYHELAKKYCPKGAGGVFTFGVKGGYEAGDFAGP